VPIGFAAGSSIVWASDRDMNTILDKIVESGATMVRFDIVWTFAEPYPGYYDWAASDRVVQAADDRGLRMLATINNSPKWAALNSHFHTGRPADPARYGQFAGKVAERYRGRISWYEIWNEPNGRIFFEPDPDPVVYTAMLKSAYAAIKNVDKNATVIAGALAAVNHGVGVIAPVEFVQHMYANSAQGWFDALSFHPYDYTAPLADGAPYPTSPIQQMVSIRRLMNANQDGDKKIWISEHGAPSAIVGDARQAQLVIETLRSWPEVSYAGPFFVHSIKDGSVKDGDASDSAEGSFGALTVGFAPRPLFTAVSALIATGNPLRSERLLFEQHADQSLGAAVTPVFNVSKGQAQQFEHGMRFRTPTGFFSSPEEVGNLARSMQILPISEFQDGYQDFMAGSILRIYSSSETGTHAIRDHIATAWDSSLGFPTSDEYSLPSGASPQVAVDFEHGRISWSAGSGATVTYHR
jgi:hypothetical protein